MFHLFLFCHLGPLSKDVLKKDVKGLDLALAELCSASREENKPTDNFKNFNLDYLEFS